MLDLRNIIQNLILGIVLSMIIPDVQAQDSFFPWIRQAGAAFEVEGTGIAIDHLGNTFLSGFFRNTLEVGGSHLSTDENPAFFIAKYDGSGNSLWLKGTSGSGSSYAYGIATDPVGNVLVTGTFQGTLELEGQSWTSYGWGDIFLAKFNPAGDLLWFRQAGGTEDDGGESIAIDEDGAIYLVGAFRETTIFGNQAITSTGVDDVFLAKYDANGNLLWLEKAGGAGHDLGFDLVTVPGQGVTMTGVFETNASFQGTILNSAGRSDIFLAHYLPDGTLDWVKQAGGNNYDFGLGIALDGQKNIYLTGSFTEQASFGAIQVSGETDSELFLAAYTNTGIPLWVTTAGGLGEDTGIDVVVDTAGRSFVTGHFTGSIQFGGTTLQAQNHTEQDIFFAGFDASGNLLKAERAGGVWEDRAWGVEIDDQGFPISAGTFTASGVFGVDSLQSQGYYSDFFLARIPPLTCTVELGPMISLCQSDTIPVMASSGFSSYEWSTGSTGPSTLISKEGSYTLKVADSNGCVAIDTLHAVYQVQTSEITGDSVVPYYASGISYSVAGTPSSTYSWSVSGGGAIVSGNGTAHILVDWTTDGGEIQVEETDTNGCIGGKVSLRVEMWCQGPKLLELESINLPAGVSIHNPDNDIGFVRSDYGAYGNSNHSATMDNYNYNAPGQIDGIIIENICIAEADQFFLVYDAAYAYYDNDFVEEFRLYYALNNDNLFHLFYQQDGISFATAGAYVDAFSPTVDQWRTDTIPLNNFLDSVGIFSIMLANVNGWGNNMFLDNIHFLRYLKGPDRLIANGVSANSIQLNWTDNSDKEAFQVIERSFSGLNFFIPIDTVEANVTSYLDEGLLANTSFDYRIRAENNTFVSSYSNVATGTTLCDAPTISLSGTDPTCGLTNGMILATVSGGQPPFTYSWSIGETSAELIDVDPGGYTLTVTDANDCPQTESIELADIPGPQVELLGTDASCGLNNGTISVSVEGGGAPYTYLWSSGDRTASISNLPTGDYALTLTDVNLCTNLENITINALPSLSLQLTLEQEITCFGGEDAVVATLAMGGTAPFQYTWSSGDTTQSVGDLGAGLYYVTITDNNNCSGVDSILVTEPAPVVANLGEDSFGCDSLILEAGNPDWSFVWSTGATSPQLMVQTSDLYSVTVTDPSGCSEVDSVQVTILQRLVADFTYIITDSVVQFMALDTLDVASYLWQFGDDTTSNLPNPKHTYAHTGPFMVSLTTSNQCGADTVSEILMLDITAVEDPILARAFKVYPNPNSGRFLIEIREPEPASYQLRLFDGNGREMLKEVLTFQGAIGKKQFQLENLASGIYFLYVIQESRWAVLPIEVVQ